MTERSLMATSPAPSSPIPPSVTAAAPATATTLPYDVVCSSSDREHWLQQRSTGIGASEIAAALGESHWCSAIELYARKIGVESNPDQTEAMFWGLRLERTIAEVYAERTGRPTKWSGLMLRSKTHPWALATLDAITTANDNSWPCDAKNVSAWKAGEWAEGAPLEYFLQAQQQMLVTGRERATLCCLLGGQRLVWCDVDRDEIAIRKLVHLGSIFWERCVVGRMQPMPDGSAGAARALSALYPTDNGSMVRLDAEFAELFDELAELKKLQKTIEQRRGEIENHVKAALGTAQIGLLPTGASFSWKTQRGGVDYKGLVEEVGCDRAAIERFRRADVRVLRQHESKER